MNPRRRKAALFPSVVADARTETIATSVGLFSSGTRESAEVRREGDQMFRLVAALFGCPHKHCTFPITVKPGRPSCSCAASDKKGEADGEQAGATAKVE